MPQIKDYKNYCAFVHVLTENDIKAHYVYPGTDEKYGSPADTFAHMLDSMN